MRIAVTGSTGLVGESVVSYFRSAGCQVTRLVRPGKGMSLAGDGDVIAWDPVSKKMDASLLEGYDAVIHLAGANIAQQRWTLSYKKLILSSRVEGTQFLGEVISDLRNPPRVLLSTSAIGYYGDITPPTCVDESSNMGIGFLAEVCEQWEKAAQSAQRKGVRVVRTRFGVVLSRKGGALAKMLPVFQVGLGGKLGSGRQMISWIALEEIPRIMEHLIHKEDISGPVNVVTPNPVSNEGFTKVLAGCLNRKAILPVPSFMIRWLLGEMGQALLLDGAAVLPKRLMESGYTFRFAYLEPALRECLFK